MMMSGDGTEERVRQYLRTLADGVQPGPGYMERLRSELRAARRRQVGGAVGAVLVCVLLAAGAMAVRPTPPAGDDRAGSTAVTAPLDFIAEVTEVPSEDWPPDPKRPRLLLRMDGTSRQPEAVVDGWRTAGPFQLLDDGSVVEMTRTRKLDGSGTGGSCASGTSRFERIAPTGERTGLGTVTGIGAFTFRLSPDGRVLAIVGRDCVEGPGEEDFHLRVYRVNGTIDARPLVDRILRAKYDDAWAEPEFSSDGRRVVFSRSAATGPLVGHTLPTAITLFLLDLDGPRPTWTDRRVRPSAAGCTSGLGGVMGRDPRTLVTSEICGPLERQADNPTLNYLVEVDLTTGRARRLLTLPALNVFGFDYDADRSHLLITTYERRGAGGRSGTPARPFQEVYAWDGGERLRNLGRLPALEAKIPAPPPTEHGTGRFWVGDAQW
jgi:hypothetical protein